MDDTFELYDLKVETVATEKPFVCSHREGEYFLVEGEPFELERTVGSKYRNIIHMNINEEEQQ